MTDPLLFKDREIVAWLAEMRARALAPEKRA